MSLFHLNWFTFSILFIFASSSSKLVQKIALKNNDVHPAAYSIFFSILVGLLSIPLGINTIQIPKVGLGIWVIFLLTSAVYASTTLLYSYALKDEDVSQLEIISTSRAMWILLLGLIFFKEAITLNKIFGVGLIFLGLFVMYWRKGGIENFGRPQILMFFYAIIVSVGYVLDKYNLNYLPLGLYQVLIFIVPGIIIAAFVPGSFSKARQMMKFNKSNLIIAVSALFYALAAFFLFSAYNAGGEVSKVGPIVQSATVLTVVFGILLLHERNNIIKKIIGAILVFAGVLFIKF